MRQTIRPFIAFASLLTITLVVSLFLIQQAERTNREIDFSPLPLLSIPHEQKVSETEFFLSKDNVIDSKDWDVYIDRKYGFQFRYPKNLRLQVSSSYSDAGGEKGITLGSKNFPTEKFWMSMGVFEGYEPQELYKYFVGGAAPGEVLQTLETSIDGHPVYLGKETIGKKDLGGIINYTYAISLSKRTVLWVDFYGFPIDKSGKEWGYLPVGQSIVQSLKIN